MKMSLVVNGVRRDFSHEQIETSILIAAVISEWKIQKIDFTTNQTFEFDDSLTPTRQFPEIFVNITFENQKDVDLGVWLDVAENHLDQAIDLFIHDITIGRVISLIGFSK